MKSFREKCYSLLQKVPKGKVTTYKEIALALNTRAYRAVGSAMKNNPNTPIVPCHRVVKSNGEIGNYSAKGGTERKISLLKEEGIKIKNNKVNLSDYIHKF